jgi:hypothetical protein
VSQALRAWERKRSTEAARLTAITTYEKAHRLTLQGGLGGRGRAGQGREGGGRQAGAGCAVLQSVWLAAAKAARWDAKPRTHVVHTSRPYERTCRLS